MGNIDLEALKAMNALIENGEGMVNSVSLANALGVRHSNLMVSIERVIRTLEETLSDNKNSHLAKGYLSRVRFKEMRYPFSTNGITKYYLLNRDFTSEILVNYSPLIRWNVMNIFWKTSDGLKEAGYDHKTLDELSDNIDDAIGKLKKLAEESYMVDWNEVDLDDDNPLFEYEPYQFAIALIREIVKKHDLAKIINLVIDAGQMDDKLCDMFIALYEFGVSSQNKVEIDLSKFKKNK